MADESSPPTGNAGYLAELLRKKELTEVRHGRRLREARDRIAALEKERDDALKASEEAAKQAKKAREEGDAALKAEADRLKGEIRLRDHRAVFDRMAIERGAYEDTRDMLWQRSGYTPEGDAPDEAKIAGILDAMRDRPGDARLFGVPGRNTPAPTPAPGSGQGGWNNGNGRMRVTTDQLKDGAWCMQHSERLQRATEDGTLDIVQS